MYKHLFGSHDAFWFIALSFLLVALFSFETNHPNRDNSHNALLNRDQTEEWKGWMQFLFVEYHYFHNVTVLEENAWLR